MTSIIVRAWREHTMSRDDAMLRKIYPNVKNAMELVIARDEGEDGILDGAQYNTLDTTWYGSISWITSLYLAALRASAAMGKEAGDAEFARKCTAIADRGSRNMVERLFNGEYFVHKTDPKHPEANSTGDGCHTDQLLGQSFAWQMGLPRIVPKEQAVSALRSMYTYAFTPDIGPYRQATEKTVKGGRWYAMPGEGGLLVCTWPKGGSDAATGKSGDAWAAAYFNECWTGFEHSVASLMIWEGLLTEGLAIERMLHDRHHGAKRNPYNEVECSSHYARAMAGYGAFIAACGFSCHGPAGEMGFDPRVARDGEFAAAFIGPEGWGRYRQGRAGHEIEVRHGLVRLKKLGLPKGPGKARVRLGDRDVGAMISVINERRVVEFEREVVVGEGEVLRVQVDR